MEQLKSRLATTNDEKYASQISGWTKESGTMLPKTVDDLMALFSNNDSVLVFDDEGALVSHAAITYTYSDGSVEIGCVITDREKRKNGAATQAVKQILVLADEKYPGNKKFALANEHSSALFEKIGAIKIPTTELSAEVWIPCKTCPRIPKQKSGQPFVCCDTPYDLTNIR
ncbi:MAG: GNAT family N-acetyltransferase [bacterium]|nr:MAG: GNAT family N-acetyltransferase [bacterium]